MWRTMLKSKIHRATVTRADLHYVGSVTVDADLMRAADLLEGEMVQIVDVTNGARLETYVITGAAGSGVLGINGAAAHLVHPGDLVILLAYGLLADDEARSLRPNVLFVDEHNRVVEFGTDATSVPAEHAAGNALSSGGAELGASVLSERSAPAEAGAGEIAETDDAARLDALLQQQERVE